MYENTWQFTRTSIEPDPGMHDQRLLNMLPCKDFNHHEPVYMMQRILKPAP